MAANQTTYHEKNIVVEVERIFTGDKRIKELIFELLQKRYESAYSHVR
jgi:hypothetical protein